MIKKEAGGICGGQNEDLVASACEDYIINRLSKAGFHITQMLEPRPTAEMAA